MKTLKICLGILCLLCVSTGGPSQSIGATFFMKEIKLTLGKVAIVDDADFNWLNQWKWCAKFSKRSKRFDAVRREPGPGRSGNIIYMHRYIMGLQRYDGLVVDHRNHNTLDYRRDNLRVCTQGKNCLNTSVRKNSKSKFLGVSIAVRKPYTYWRAVISVNGKLTSLGYYEFTDSGEIEAAIAYNNAAKKYFGDFANLNQFTDGRS